MMVTLIIQFLCSSDPTDPLTKLGKQTINQVTIINDDGKFKLKDND